MKVLAIDDNHETLAALQAVVRAALPGCELLTAASGATGMERACHEDPDVVLFDLAVAARDGFEACRRRQDNDGLRAIPVVFVTASHSDRGSRIKALEAGADGFLARPLDELELTAQVQAMARLKAARCRAGLEPGQLAPPSAERTRELQQELAERQRREEALSRSEALLSATGQMAKVGGWEIDVATQTLTWTAEVYRIHDVADGFQPTVAAGIDFYAPESQPVIAAAVRRAIEHGDAFDVELQFITARKVPRWVHAKGEARVQGGRIVTVAGTFQDITERKQAELALRESEARYRRLFESVQDVFYEVALDGTIQEISPSIAVVSKGQYTRADLLGRSMYEFYPTPQMRDAVLRTLREKGSVTDYEVTLRNRDASLIPCSLSARIQFDAGGQPSNIIGTLRDITERRQAEVYRAMGMDILQSLNEPGTTRDCLQRVLGVLKTRTGFDAVGIRLQDGDDFPYVVQQGFSEDFVLTENTLIERAAPGGTCRDCAGNACLECACGLVICGKVDPALPLFTRGGSFWTNDAIRLLDLLPAQDPRHHPRNRCIHDGYASLALVPIRDQDRIVGLIQFNDRRKGCLTLAAVELLEGTAAHIGAALMRRQAEEALRESEQLLRESQVVADLGSYALDIPAGRWASSLVLDRVFGIDKTYERSVAGWVALVHPDDRNAMNEYFQNEVLGQGRTFDREYRIIRHHDQAERWVYGRGSLEFDAQGQPRRMVGTIQDITKHKQAEATKAALETQLQQVQKMDSIGRLAGGVAHDFNNLLMGMMNYVELCRDEIPPTHPARTYLDEITTDARRSAGITQQLLAFARKQVIAPKVLDLNDALAGMLKMLRRLMGEDIDLTWMPGLDLWLVKIDPGQLDQLLANLCVNARDAIAGVGRVAIETANTTLGNTYCAQHAGTVPGEYVRLAVSDNGCGMSMEVLAHIFEPFYTTKGTGLGLATVYGIVEQNHGRVEVQSAVGEGTRFTIYLPRATAEVNLTAVAAAPAERPRGTETILLAEDEKSVRVTSRQFLQQLGYTVLAAETPEEALRLAGAHPGPIDLLITDVIMPGMNGPALAGLLAEARPQLKCLFMSGYTADVITHRGTLDTTVQFLSKPFSRDELVRKVRQMLDGEQGSTRG
jgi:PAS domain S-box-containing protein